MERIEKTVFVSYRRTDESWGLAIFQNLTQHGYDVFIDYDGIASGNFATAIKMPTRICRFLPLISLPTSNPCGSRSPFFGAFHALATLADVFAQILTAGHKALSSAGRGSFARPLEDACTAIRRPRAHPCECGPDAKRQPNAMSRCQGEAPVCSPLSSNRKANLRNRSRNPMRVMGPPPHLASRCVGATCTAPLAAPTGKPMKARPIGRPSSPSQPWSRSPRRTGRFWSVSS